MAIGKKTGGGSRKGRQNKASAAKEAAIKASGLTPLEFMLRVMAEEPPHDASPQVRASMRALQMDAAKASAPYVHPKLANVEVTGKNGGPLQVTVVKYKADA